MNANPVVVGINRTQDGSISVIDGASVYSLQKERITRRKHHWGRLGDVHDLYAGLLQNLHEPVDLVVESYSSDSEIENRVAYRQELEGALRFRRGARVVQVSHHLAHLSSAFHPSPFESAAAMVIDCQGSPAGDFSESDAQFAAAPDLLEVASFYRCDRTRIECVGKQLWDGDWARPTGLGCFYYQLTRMIFPGEGNEGKVMGLAPFGNPDALGLPPLTVRGERVLIPDEWIAIFQQGERFRFSAGEGGWEGAADLAAAGQRVFEDALLEVAGWLHRETALPDLCFAGGIALNCSANSRLLRESQFKRLFIPPSPHDGGTALGSALYGLSEQLGIRPAFRWENDFLGPDDDAAAKARLVTSLPRDELLLETPDDIAGRIARLLESGRVVGIHDGRSESGPRALGNRSILADPRRPSMQSFINDRVKGREWFRPLAPIVPLQVAPALFDIDRPAPFMQFAASVRPKHRPELPATTHVDGTARLQTVDEQNTPLLWALLMEFEARTGCPVLLNTSLNGPGQPLAESPDDAVDCLRTTDMHALAMPPFLIRKRREPDVPSGRS